MSAAAPRVGIVAVSHSRPLAEAAVALALEMVAGDPPPIAIAAGTADGGTGTDAVRVSEAIVEVGSGGAGVVVLMDLGSAVMSAEMALEFVADPELRVRLVSAPFVEGLLAAVVRAAGGADLDAVAAEALGALRPKSEQLGDAAPVSVDRAVDDAGDRADAPPAPAGDLASTAPPPAIAEAVVRNVAGLHARPAAEIAGLVAQRGVALTLATDAKGPVDATSPIGIAILGAGPGTIVRIAASGAGAAEAVEEVRALIESGFGEELAELDVAPTAPAAPSHPLGVSSGRVVGPVAVMVHAADEPDPAARIPADQRDGAAARLREAMLAVAGEMHETAQTLSGQRRDVLVATAAIAADPALHREAESFLRDEGLTPERAVWVELGRTAVQYRELGGRMAERVTDLVDVRDRIIARLTGVERPGVPERDHPFILVADDLAPVDTVGLDPERCLAIVTEQGGPTSHTAILARELGLPAIVGAAGATAIADGTVVLVDGDTGELIVQPDEGARATATGVITLPPFEGPGETADGHRVVLGANVGAPRDIRRAVERGAEGVGLFRTEFCFLDRTREPSVDDQIAAYREVFAAFPDRRVVVRTLDAGSDKPLPFLTSDDEPNPALGVRGYRTSRRDPEVLDAQLRAIARAADAERADAWVMAPMIATVAEATEFAARARAAGNRTVGVMIETPAAALVADELCAAVDFVSIGTNDLSQYTMAADRMSGELAHLADPWQPAVLRAIRLIGESGARTGTPVGVCGEAAADPALAPVLVGLGVTSLSMAARAITAVGAIVSSATLAQCRAAAEAACAATDPAAARAAAREALAT
ncbi:MAG: phosphoenolpyruvate--protein phosphotransferase [Microcella sp.]|uniref:phosphoenolpyruvate--protein phosphotransferase n=1 Tax=Microcella sp. TaxID=1913979 RepID=UPI0027279FA6|nr:phosphoenolpyruvate--protein phosphotransferase [Microcella sp.]MDO8337309.1 phosphoenolpyruvate--protein phosphotransferase [Microcella sp.]